MIFCTTEGDLLARHLTCIGWSFPRTTKLTVFILMSHKAQLFSMFPFDFLKTYFPHIATKMFPNVHQNVLSPSLKQRILEQTHLLTVNYTGLCCLPRFIPCSLLGTVPVTSPLFSNIPTISHLGFSPSIRSALLSLLVWVFIILQF